MASFREGSAGFLVVELSQRVLPGRVVLGGQADPAGHLARQHGLPNLEYRLGDIEEIPIDSKSVDLAVFSQALHHAADPAGALGEAHRILKKGGSLIVLDLLQHSFEQARDLYADTHLGFAEVELA